MQRLSGLLLMLAGACLAGYVYLPTRQDGAETLAEVTRISAAPDRSDARSGVTTPVAAPVVTAALPAPAANTANTQQGMQPAASGSTWTAVVTAEPATGQKLSSSKPGDAQTRIELTRDLQRELQRVGCYDGDINGTWTPATRGAMSTFMERVNATLPIDEPDYILLTLVQGHAAAACGTDCPAGQVMEANRCVPRAVVAQAARKTQRATDMRKAADQERLAEAQRKDELRKTAEASRVAAEAERARLAAKAEADAKSEALAARRLEDQRVAEARRAAEQQRLASERKLAEQQQQASAREVLPWQQDAKPDAKPNVVAAVEPEAVKPPLPGRMSVGGPTPVAEPPASSRPIPQGDAPLPVVVAPNQTDTSEIEDERNAIIQAPQLKPRSVVQRPHRTHKPMTKKFATMPPMPRAPQHSVAAVAPERVEAAPPPRLHKPRQLRMVRRPPPAPQAPVVVYKAPRPYSSYSYAYAGKPRRGDPRPGTMRHNLMLSLGGIY